MGHRLTRQESRERTREELIAAGDRVFVREGYHGATLAMIAEEAGFTTGAVYSAFDSKADLFLAVLDRRRGQRLEELAEMANSGTNLRASSAQWFERLRRERAWHIVSLEFQLHAARDPELNRRYLSRHRALVAGLARMAQGRAAGEDEEAPLDEIGWALGHAALAVGNGYALERLTDPDHVSDEDLARAEAIVMRGLQERLAVAAPDQPKKAKKKARA